MVAYLLFVAFVTLALKCAFHAGELAVSLHVMRTLDKPPLDFDEQVC